MSRKDADTSLAVRRWVRRSALVAFLLLLVGFGTLEALRFVAHRRGASAVDLPVGSEIRARAVGADYTDAYQAPVETDLTLESAELGKHRCSVAAARALALTMGSIRATTFLFLGLGLVPLGVLIAWSGAVARWLGWLGVVAGVLGFLGVLAAIFNVVVGRLMFMSVIFLMFGFILILGVRLLVRETLEATESRA